MVHMLQKTPKKQCKKCISVIGLGQLKIDRNITYKSIMQFGGTITMKTERQISHIIHEYVQSTGTVHKYIPLVKHC